MNQSNFQSLLNNSIRQEIQRFESVHPSIYAIYALIGHISDLEIADQIQKHIVCIEDSFVNSQEWTISRAVNDFRIGIVGTSHSGKSALVHRYLTGSFMQEDSPEGGRFKKEISIDNQSYMLLIRDEGGAPEFQFAAWVDAIIFVFSLENESSYNAIYNYFTLMCNLRQDSDIPILLVGTQDAISEMYPRVIDDSKARKLANDLKKCSYYETCAVYGLNVDRVFQDACSQILQHRMMKQSSIIVATNNFRSMEVNDQLLNYMNGGAVDNSPLKSTINNNSPVQKNAKTLTLPQKSWSGYNACSKKISDLLKSDESTIFNTGIRDAKSEIPGLSSPGQLPIILYDNFQQMDIQLRDKEPHLTPSSTPTAARKSRRRSNLFIPTKKNDEKLKGNCELGSGRKIPIKQGYLYKKSSKSLNKEWKKKYVTLCDGCLSYYPSLHDYMDDIHGKDVDLHYVTVKVPGQKPRGSKSIITNSALTKKKVQTCLGISNLIMSENKKDKDAFGDSNGRSSVNSRTSGDEISLLNAAGSNSQLGSDEYVDNKVLAETQTSTNAKKRHRRMKSSGVKNGDAEDQDGFEFFIVAIDNKQWQFEAANSEERNEWVELIDKEIFKSLQTTESSKSDSNYVHLMQSIKSKVPGNDVCADCSSPIPEWASLNLGILMCIECSGIHRNLGSHISKVRSLGLDEWPPSHLWVMLSIGNSLANSIWERNTHGKKKPTPSSSREDKEKWIKSKYESKSFLPTCDFSTRRIEQQLVEAVADADMKAVILLLTHVTSENINCTVSSRDLRTPLHLACATGNLAITQLLIWHHADIHLIDHEGRNVLSFAKVANQEALPETKEMTISLVEFLTNLGCTDPMDSTLLTHYRESNLEL